jgi:hypothetical protein
VFTDRHHKFLSNKIPRIKSVMLFTMVMVKRCES